MPENSMSASNRLAVDRPTRDADRNRTVGDHADAVMDDMLLPSLDDGITLLDVKGGRGVPIVQSLVLDHLLLHDGSAFWVDANGHATTTTLAQIAPSQRLLDRIHVARGFTAYQHHGVVSDLPTAVNRSIQQSTTDIWTEGRQTSGSDQDVSRQSPSLIVAPAVDVQYRDDDTLGKRHAETLLARSLAQLSTYAEAYDVPALLTRTKSDDFAASVAAACDHQLECEQTKMGPRFVGDDFETLVYPVDEGAHYQTTFAYWQQLLAARATQVGLEPARSPQAVESTADVGTGVTMDGTTTTVSANPLLEALTAAGAGGR